jgi:CheY-like chemotaxis protein
MPSVLIVDDSDDMRRMIRSVIDGIADPILECRDGVDALAACTRYRPDCVLMDIEMPIMDGIAATRQILGALPSTTILMVSQYNDKRMRHAAAQAGACGYVLKENLLELRVLLQGLAGSAEKARAT